MTDDQKPMSAEERARNLILDYQDRVNNAALPYGYDFERAGQHVLPDPAEVAQVLKWGVDPAEGPSESAVWPLANDVEPTRGKWVAGNYLPDAPATTSAPQFDDDERRGWHRGECCNRYGCNGTMGLFVIGSSSGVQCSHCGYVVPGPNPNPTDEAW